MFEIWVTSSMCKLRLELDYTKCTRKPFACCNTREGAEQMMYDYMEGLLGDEMFVLMSEGQVLPPRLEWYQLCERMRKGGKE